ncbi:MAG TPA: formate dehydrogenase accessory protein FdhE, partial [Thermodesulfobacteriota bacterium]|nr:formate dehydrogenase accessory protein FdhE [Thermodesulfobacteriota bacterium]
MSTFATKDREILEALAKCRNEFRNLEEVLAFYENLFRLQFAFKSLHLSRGGYMGEISMSKCSAGEPQVTFDELQMGTAPFPGLFADISKLLGSYAGISAPAEGPEGEWVLSEARAIYSARTPLVFSGWEENLPRTAAGLTMAPFLFRAREVLLPAFPQDSWGREYCPVCGGVPSMARLSEPHGFRDLLCSRCHAEWKYPRVGCPFCLEKFGQTYYPSEDGRHRLYVCSRCRRYLKCVDARAGDPQICLPVEAIVTVGMD